MKTFDGPSAFNLFQEQMHHYVKVSQNFEYQYQRSNLKAGEIMIHVDFSENYNNKLQNATQTAYFEYEQFSLYTVAVYYQEQDDVKCDSFVLIPPTTDHSRMTVFSLNTYLLQLLARKMDINIVHFWSDGCAAQFRNKFCLELMTKISLHVKLYWHYFESHHGKGAVDGIVGCVKSLIYGHVMAKKVVLKEPNTFCRVC